MLEGKTIAITRSSDDATEFIELAREIAMHVAATNPTFVKREDVPEDAVMKAKELFAKEVEDKPADMQEKILEGKLASYFKDQILLEQAFIKNPDNTIAEMVTGAVQKFGENVQVVSFSRVSVK